MVNNSLTAD